MPRQRTGNRKRGEVVVDGVGVIKFTWDRIEQLRDDLGNEFDGRISVGAANFDLEILSKALSVGTGGEKSAEDIRKISPPIAVSYMKLMQALNLAFHGTEATTVEDVDENFPTTDELKTSTSSK